MEMHVGFLARQLAQRGHRILAACAPNTPLAQDFRDSGFEPYLLDHAGYFQPRSLARLLRCFKTKPVEIVHAHYSRDLWTLVPAMSLSRAARKLPLLLTKHVGTGKPKRDFLHRRLYHRVDYLIAISEVIQQNLIATHPLTPEKVGVIHHGVALERFSPATISERGLRSALGFSQNEVVVGMVGRLQVSKGFLEFLEMARLVHRARPNTRFVIAGEPTRGEPREAEIIRAKWRELQLENIVTFLGFRQDVPAVLAALEIFVFPSHAEAFGLALLEAMAAGKAVIASNNDGVLDLVPDERFGLLVPPRNVAALAQACLRLVDEEALRRKMGEASREFVRQNFSVQRMLERTEALYYRLQARRGMAASENKNFSAALAV
jgi:glycosyltransferase involved in cell wall biosynthesis